jgi:hypothetical protein
MKNRLAAISRRIIPYNPEFRRLPLVKSVNSALLLQQLDFWFDKHSVFWKFIEPAPNHSKYREGDSWTEELGMTKDEFRTAFANIGIPYKSKNQFRDAENKFIQKDSEGNEIEYYYASYFDRQHSLTYYIRNDELLDRELAELVQSSSLKNRVRPEKPVPEENYDNIPHGTLRTEPLAPLASPTSIADPVVAVVTVELPKPAKIPKRSIGEIEAEKAAKAEQKRLAAEARAEAKRLKQEQLERDNQWRYELFGGKERYTRFNAWFWGVYLKSNTLDNPGMFYSIMMNNLRDGGEKYRYIVVMFDQAEQKVAQEAKVQQEQEQLESVSIESIDDGYLESMLSVEELDALNAAQLDSDVRSFLLRQMQQQNHKMRMQCIEVESDLQKGRNYRRKRLEAQA